MTNEPFATNILFVNNDTNFFYCSRAIKTNPDVQPTTPWVNLLANDFWGTPLTHSGSHKSYRPLCVLSFRINYWLHELEPFGYHFVNVLLHCLATALVTHLAGCLFHQARMPTAVAGFLFAAHPIHTEAVAGIVGRADVGAAIFFMLAFFSYQHYVILRTSLLIYHTGASSHAKLKSYPSANYAGNSNGGSGLPSIEPIVTITTTSSSPCRSFLATLAKTIVKWPLTVLEPMQRVAPCTVTMVAVRKWLYIITTLICAACSMLTKEHGVTVLAVCAVYDLFVHSRMKPKEIASAIFHVSPAILPCTVS